MLSAFGLTLSVLRLPRIVRWRKDPMQAERGPDDGSGRRPPSGGKDGPPDLDELWQDFNRRINGLLGGKNAPGGRPTGGGGGGGGPKFGGFGAGPTKKGASIGAGIIMIVMLLIWLASGFFIVQEGQGGVILQFGKYKTTTGPGFQWRLPYPVQSHEVVNIGQARKIEVGFRGRTKVPGEALMLTDDENIIDIQFSVLYRLKDAADFLFKNRNAEENVRQAAETSVREVVGRSKMDFVLYEGREQVAIEVEKLMQTILDRYETGILVTSVTIQDAQPPAEVQAAFNDAVKALQDRERQKSEGQAYANDVIPRATGAASRLIEEANGYRQRIIAQAEGDASRFGQILTEYSKAPGVTRDRMYLETMQQIFSNTSKVLIDAKSGSNLLYLPLDKLMQAAGAPVPEPLRPGAATSVVPPSAASVPANNGALPGGTGSGNAADPAARDRDSLRNRDRETR